MIVVLIPFGERGDLFSDLNRDRSRWMREAARSSLAMDSKLFSRRIVHRTRKQITFTPESQLLTSKSSKACFTGNDW